jgi:hypothetical protein
MSRSGPIREGRFSGIQVAGVAVAAVLGTALLTLWVVRTYVYPSEFTPVRLSAAEQKTLDAKLERLESTGDARRSLPKPEDAGDARRSAQVSEDDRAWLRPEPYDESDATREIVLTEREINALIATNTDLAPRAAIDLSEDLASARLLIPVDPDFPVLGGRTLRVNAGVELAFRSGRPVVALKGVSVMGVPIPNAWLGNLKNVDLVEEFGVETGFWSAFAAGVEQIAVEDGRLRIRLRE